MLRINARGGGGGAFIKFFTKKRDVYLRRTFNRRGRLLKNSILAKHFVFLSEKNIKNHNNNE